MIERGETRFSAPQRFRYLAALRSVVQRRVDGLQVLLHDIDVAATDTPAGRGR
jgi:hypothetical protein